MRPLNTNGTVTELWERAGRPTPADGIYFVWPEGSGWDAVRVRDGRVIAATGDADADTHAAARDAWAGIVPTDDTEHDIPVADQLAVLAAAEYGDHYAECMVVTRYVATD